MERFDLLWILYTGLDKIYYLLKLVYIYTSLCSHHPAYTNWLMLLYLTVST